MFYQKIDYVNVLFLNKVGSNDNCYVVPKLLSNVNRYPNLVYLLFVMAFVLLLLIILNLELYILDRKKIDKHAHAHKHKQ